MSFIQYFQHIIIIIINIIIKAVIEQAYYMKQEVEVDWLIFINWEKSRCYFLGNWAGNVWEE